MIPKKQSNKMIFFGPSGIGDWCFIYPSFAQLIHGFNPDWVTVVLAYENDGNRLLKHNNLINEVIYLNRITSGVKTLEYFFRILRFANKIRKENYKIAICSILSNQPDFLILTLLSGASTRIGCLMKDSALERLAFNKTVHCKGQDKIRAHNAFLRYTIVDKEQWNPPPLFPNQLFSNTYVSLNKFNLKEKQYIILGVGGGRNAGWRFWPAEKYAALALTLPKYKCVLMGGGDDDKKQARIITKMNENVIDLVGKTSMVEGLHLIKNAALIIGNDSGIANIASTLHVPTICIYGPTDPNLTGPALLGAKVVFEKQCSYQPCFNEYTDTTRALKCTNRVCLVEITVEKVTSLCQSLLDHS